MDRGRERRSERVGAAATSVLSETLVIVGEGNRIVAAHETEVARRRRLRWAVLALVVAAVAAAGVVTDAAALGVAAAGIVVAVWWLDDSDGDDRVPDLVDERIRRERATSIYDVDAHAANPWAREE